MEIRTMKDLKNVLNTIPDDVLEFFGVGQDGDGEIAILTEEGNDEGDMVENWNKRAREHPNLYLLADYFRRIGDEARNEGEPLVDFVKAKKSLEVTEPSLSKT